MSCTEENITNNDYSYKRTLVVITDLELNSNLLLSIQGEARANYKDVEVVVLESKKFDVYEAGYLLRSAFNKFPQDAYFCVVVDPGASDKKLYAEYEGRKIIVPNNGILSILAKGEDLKDAHYLDDMANFPNYTDLSEIPYHELYATGIKKMLDGDSPSSYGTPLDSLKQLVVQDVENNAGVLKGQVEFVDNFGNCVTNFTRDDLKDFAIGDFIQISSGNKVVNARLTNSYNAVPDNHCLALYDDNSRLNLAVSFGNFSQKYDIKAGDIVSIVKKTFRIGILRYNDSDVATNIMNGIKSQLKSLGLEENVNVEYMVANAHSEIANFAGLVDDMLATGVDLVVPISTPASQAAVKYVPANIPVVYTYVTSPEYAGLIGKRNNTTGISDATNFNDYLKFVKELFPDLQVAGRIYNNTEPNSAFAQEEISSLASFYNLDLSVEAVTSASDVSAAFNQLNSQGIKTILVAADNTLNLAMENLSQLCADNAVSLIGDSQENVDNGALAAISVDYDELADISGKTVFAVLLGIDPDNIDIIKLPTSLISLNKKTANKIGYTFPSAVLARASHIVD
jgi:putative ABC transport system substrate-binding protein